MKPILSSFSSGSRRRVNVPLRQSHRKTVVLGGIAILSIFAFAPASQAAQNFTCAGGDVHCLSAAISAANVNGQENVVTLGTGVYTLSNHQVPGFDDPSGYRIDGSLLPTITGKITIEGVAPENTVLQGTVPGRRLFGVATSGILSLVGVTLTGGHGLGGGAVLALGAVKIVHSIISGNSAGFQGGGILMGAGTLTIVNSTISHNRASDGGGIWTENANVTIMGSSVTSNSAPNYSSLEVLGGTMTVADSTIADNSDVFEPGPRDGRMGIFAARDSGIGARVSVINSTIANNAGGIFLSTGQLAVINSTIANNFGRFPGLDVGTTGVAGLHGSILRNNAIADIPNDCRGQVTSFGHNVIGDPVGCTISLLPTDQTGDPGLGPFTDDGTPGNGHFPLQQNSPAIDRGNDFHCPQTDQLGQPRIGICDIGAIEFQPPSE